MAEYLGAGLGQAPPEYIRYRLRTMYHCPPSVLAEQTGEYFFEMLQDLTCERWEAKTARMKRTLRGG